MRHWVFKVNIKIFDWDIPANDDRKSAQMISRNDAKG